MRPSHGRAHVWFHKKYYESHSAKTALQLAGLPASDLGIIGDLRRHGVHASFRF